MRAKLTAFSGSTILLLAVLNLTAQTTEPAKGGANPPALALVILYDGSGSMKDNVPDIHGKPTPKYKIADDAVVAIAKKVEDYRVAKNINIDAGLVYFVDAKVKTGIPLQPFAAKGFQEWARNFQSPIGGTPLGNGIAEANKMLAQSKALKRHILVITDGESNVGDSPEVVIRRLSSKANPDSIYFVAFDVSAKVFDPVKKLGATVVSAKNELELNNQVDALLGKKILLEAE